jgi:hypothetical protein
MAKKREKAEAAPDGRLDALEKRVARLWSLAVPRVASMKGGAARRRKAGAGKAPITVMEISPGSLEVYQFDSEEPVAFVFVPSSGGVEWWAMRTNPGDSWVYHFPSSSDNDPTPETFVPLPSNTLGGPWQNESTDEEKAEGYAERVAAYYVATYGSNPDLELTVHRNSIESFGPYS